MDNGNKNTNVNPITTCQVVRGVTFSRSVRGGHRKPTLTSDAFCLSRQFRAQKQPVGTNARFASNGTARTCEDSLQKAGSLRPCAYGGMLARLMNRFLRCAYQRGVGAHQQCARTRLNRTPERMCILLRRRCARPHAGVARARPSVCLDRVLRALCSVRWRYCSPLHARCLQRMVSAQSAPSPRKLLVRWSRGAVLLFVFSYCLVSGRRCRLFGVKKMARCIDAARA